MLCFFCFFVFFEEKQNKKHLKLLISQVFCTNQNGSNVVLQTVIFNSFFISNYNIYNVKKKMISSDEIVPDQIRL